MLLIGIVLIFYSICYHFRVGGPCLSHVHQSRVIADQHFFGFSVCFLNEIPATKKIRINKKACHNVQHHRNMINQCRCYVDPFDLAVKGVHELSCTQCLHETLVLRLTCESLWIKG